MKQGTEACIREQFEELAGIFPGLTLCQDNPGDWVVRGDLSFSATYQGDCIEDTFSIKMEIPSDFPDSPPTVQETGGRIPAGFHQYGDRTLCLGAPAEVNRRFKSDPRLLAFVQTLVVEYLYGYASFEKNGTLPFGELSHGCQGIREYYQDTFRTEDVNVVFPLLKVLAEGSYRGHYPCPCASGTKLRKCHGPTLLGLINNQSREDFLRDARNVLYSLGKEELKGFDWDALPKELKQEIDEMTRERARMEKCA